MFKEHKNPIFMSKSQPFSYCKILTGNYCTPISNFRLGNCTLIENLLTEGQRRFCAASMNTFPTFSDKISRQFGMVAKQHGWNRSRVTIERNDRGGGASWIVVYHLTDLDEAFVRANYAVSWDIAPEDTVTVEPYPTDSSPPPEDEDCKGVQQEIDWCVQRE